VPKESQLPDDYQKYIAEFKFWSVEL
jgi:hypothetical protein